MGSNGGRDYSHGPPRVRQNQNQQLQHRRCGYDRCVGASKLPSPAETRADFVILLPFVGVPHSQRCMRYNLGPGWSRSQRRYHT